ncbi:hypothetical protein RvY_05293 [Ramazzottius varieornatus]|uniref:Uncharacterized protein n=1 Tax=Ramazzottius varieornatus TaxID=947166 RepID=A0A1D1V4D1_RAMVA|nr:hypothetical protein RvY_05293 [Ramazzottius varieornatus]
MVLTEEDKKGKEESASQHGQSVQEEHHQNAHAYSDIQKDEKPAPSHEKKTRCGNPKYHRRHHKVDTYENKDVIYEVPKKEKRKKKTYRASVTQLSRITAILILSNQSK